MRRVIDVIVSVTADGVELLEADDFTKFHVAAPAGVDVVAVLEQHVWGTAADGGDVWINVGSLTAGERSAEWTTSFEKMLAYAESKGWTDGERRRIRAHLELT